MGYMDFRKAEIDSANLMELGLGYINEIVPQQIENSVIPDNGSLSNYLSEKLTGLTPSQIVKNFELVVNNIQSGGDSNSITITHLETESTYYKTYSLVMSASEIGPILLTDNYFPKTILAYSNLEGLRRLYYLPIDDLDNVVLIASFDVRFLPETSWLADSIQNIIYVLPLVGGLGLIMGWLISRITIGPIIGLTKWSEQLAAGDLSQTLSLSSKDELGRLSTSLNYMAERIQASFDSQRRFVSNAAHELKTPLSSMKVAVTAALENNKSNEEYQELVQFVAQRIKTQELLIAELLFLAQSDEKRLASQFNIMNISEIICEFKETFAYVFEEKNIDLKECITDEIFIRGDRKLISQLIMNLLDNALAYTPKGGVVIISLTRDKNWAILTVKDNGRGIPEDSLDKVFERFYKVPNETPANSGFGLGLSICKSIVQTLGGNIRVNSNLNLGTIFTVLLPLVEHDKHKK